jgi:hypothetical protein
VTSRQKWTIAALVPYAIALIISTHIPIPQIVYSANVSDKWIHFLAYLILVFLIWYSIRPQSRPMWRKPLAWLILVIVCAYGGIDEFIQPYFGRTKDFFDFVANSEGVITGFIIFTFLPFWQSLLAVLAISIFGFTNLAKANLSQLVPVTDSLFNFLSYACFALVWVQFMRLYLFSKSAAVRLFLALIVPAGFMLIVKAGSLLLKRHFGLSDLLFGFMGIIAVAAISHLTGFLHSRQNSEKSI